MEIEMVDQFACMKCGIIVGEIEGCPSWCPYCHEATAWYYLGKNGIIEGQKIVKPEQLISIPKPQNRERKNRAEQYNG